MEKRFKVETDDDGVTRLVIPSNELMRTGDCCRNDSMDDPLEDLLNEFSDLSDDDMSDSLQFKNDDMSRVESDIFSSDVDELLDYISEQMKMLEESKERIRYFLDEMELAISN